jgi:hypothetical protein
MSRQLVGLCGTKELFSCSSGDIEFNSLLQLMARGKDGHRLDPLADLVYEAPRASLKVFRGGFPINFDGTAESVPAEEIQLTRGLLLGGVIQAALRDGSDESHIGEMLAPITQQYVVSSWARHYGDARPGGPVLSDFRDIHWIESFSSGHSKAHAALSELFAAPGGL